MSDHQPISLACNLMTCNEHFPLDAQQFLSPELKNNVSKYLSCAGLRECEFDRAETFKLAFDSPEWKAVTAARVDLN